MKTNEYKKAINEIKASNDLKIRTIQMVEDQGKFNKYIVTKRILSFAAVFVVIFSFIITNNKTKVNENVQGNNLAKLPVVGSYDNMKSLLEKSIESNRYDYITDGVVYETTETKNSVSNSTDHSTTNVQVQGVDEGDLVKTNGKYIFYCKNSKISIVDVETEKVISVIEYKNDMPQEMYLKENKLIVILYKDTKKVYNYSRNAKLKIIQYDISNPKELINQREIEVEGNLLSSRMIDNMVYIVSNKYIYSDLITDEEKLKPVYKDTAIGEEEKCVSYNDIYYFPEMTSACYMLVTGFDISNTSKPANMQTYLGCGEDIYASTENLYVTCRNYEESENSRMQYYYSEKTKVYKFSLKDGNTEYEADAIVPGYIDNQFSMDEYNGYFRIATTYNSKDSNYEEVNNLYVLDKDMKLVGQIENLAPKESIHAVRYMGDKAYVVTFEQIDPLFVIDLSDPTKPKVLGELKIPGYSEYLHPYDETHIIGFGRDTETDGKFVKNAGFKMALFDVSDLSKPKEISSVIIGDAGTYSELIDNHKALLFSKEKNIIAFPITIKEKQNDSKYYSKTTFNGALIYGVSLTEGFKERKRVESETSIDRVIYVGNKMYTLSENDIKIIDINAMEEIGKIEL